MERIIKIVFTFREYLTVLLGIILSSLLIISNKNTQVENLQAKLVDATGVIKQKFVWMRVIFNALNENRSLRENVLYLTLENSRLKEAEIENLRLRKMLGFGVTDSLRYLPAMVVSRGFHQIVNSLQINVGNNNSVKKNMPVITEKGLVGKIYLVGNKNSLVEMMTDVNFKVSAKLLNSRATGIIQWKNDNIFEMNYVLKGFKVSVGDTVITSGYSQIYPPKIPVGIVSDVTDNNPEIFKRITVKSFVDFSLVEEVFIIISEFNPEFVLE